MTYPPHPRPGDHIPPPPPLNYGPPPRRRAWPWIAAGVAALLLLGCIGVAAVIGTAADQAAQQVTESPRARATTAAPPATPGARPATSAPPAARKPAALPTEFAGDGAYEVGKDIAPGRYRSDGPTGGGIEMCVWELNAADGDFIDGGVSAGPQFAPPGSGAKLKPGDTIKVTGCRPWSMTT